MAHQSPEHPTPGFAPLAALSLSLLVAGAILYAFLASAPTIEPVSARSFRLLPDDVDVERLKAERAKALSAASLEGAEKEAEDLREAFRNINLMQFRRPTAKQIRDAEIFLNFAAAEVLTVSSAPGFMLAGQPVIEACMKGLHEVMGAVANKTITIAQATGEVPEQFESYRKNCGNFLGYLQDLALVDRSGRFKDQTWGPVLAEILARYRWAYIIHLHSPAYKQLTPYEYELFTRWRIGDPDAHPYSKRLEFVTFAEQTIPNFRGDVARGNLSVQRGDFEGALVEYEKACKKHPSDMELQRRCEWLRAKVDPPAAEHAEKSPPKIR